MFTLVSFFLSVLHWSVAVGGPAPELLRNVNPLCHPYCPHILHKHSLPSLPGLPVYLEGLIRRKTWGKQLKREEPEDKNPRFLYTRLILDLMRSLVNHWSHLTRASHIMTTSRPAVCIHLRVCGLPTAWVARDISTDTSQSSRLRSHLVHSLRLRHQTAARCRRRQPADAFLWVRCRCLNYFGGWSLKQSWSCILKAVC